MKRNWLVTARIIIKDDQSKFVQWYFETKANAEQFMEKFSRVCGNQLKNLDLMNTKTKKHRGYIYVFDL